MAQSFDVIVIGVGGIGSAACAHLAERGVSVLGLEQFPFVHDRGSSHGETRIIRLAYFEHPNYVPLLRRAYELWDRLERQTGQFLFRKTQLLLSGPPSGDTIRGALAAAEQHHLTIERLTPADVARRFPGFALPADHGVVLEPDAGFLWVERCVEAHLQVAKNHGATLRDNTPVRSIQRHADSVVVRTDDATYTAARLIVTAGAWTSQVLGDLAVPLTVSRQFVGWFEVANSAYHVDRGYPCFFVEQADGAYYGFPSLDGRTIKAAEHSHPEIIADPSRVDRNCYERDWQPLTRFLQQTLPEATGQLSRHSVCLYTLTPDHHFLIDRVPGASHIVVACGFSGHGFKFASVMGEVLADLSLQGTTPLPVRFLRGDRFASIPPDALG